jgi:putative intracellular protease/amidase
MKPRSLASSHTGKRGHDVRHRLEHPRGRGAGRGRSTRAGRGSGSRRCRTQGIGAVDDLESADSDLLILPGAEHWDAGGGGAFADLAERFLLSGVPVAAICGATAGLARHGLLDNRRHTSAAAEYLAATGYRTRRSTSRRGPSPPMGSPRRARRAGRIRTGDARAARAALRACAGRLRGRVRPARRQVHARAPRGHAGVVPERGGRGACPDTTPRGLAATRARNGRRRRAHRGDPHDLPPARPAPGGRAGHGRRGRAHRCLVAGDRRRARRAAVGRRGRAANGNDAPGSATDRRPARRSRARRVPAQPCAPPRQAACLHRGRLLGGAADLTRSAPLGRAHRHGGRVRAAARCERDDAAGGRGLETDRAG